MTEGGAGGKVKKFLYVNRKAPYGTIYALESLEVVLIGAAFEQDVSLAFVGDGVYQLARGQDTKGLEVKNFSPAFRALEDYDVNKLYVDEESLRARVADAGGGEPPWPLGGFEDLEASVREQLDILRTTPHLLGGERSRGYVYEVDSGELREVSP